MTSGTSGPRTHLPEESGKRFRGSPMTWLRRCCCCCCFWCGCGLSDVDDKPTSLDDSSSLIGQQEEATPSQEHAFYVPRRHSSFMPGTCYNSTSGQSEQHPQSECSTSSDEEGGGTQQRRGRCWSTVPALDSTLAARGRSVGPQTTTPRNRVNGVDLPSNCAGTLAFDKHVLSEIAEVEQGSGEEPPTAGGYHAQRADAEIYGYLTFTTLYEKQEQRLTVHLNQATGLPRKGEEPYGTFVRMGLVTCPPSSNGGNGHNSRPSRTVKRCLEPVYGEEHLFHTHRSKWKTGSRSAAVPYLRLSVVDSERQGRHDALGHALLPLEEIEGEKREHRLPLTPMSLPVHNLGQVLIGLQYVPTQSRLTVHVIKARHLRLDPEFHKRHLRPLNAKETLDSFCKVTLTCGGQKVKTCRSRAVTGTDPFFDFRSSFVVPPQYLRDTGTLVSLVARSTLGRQGATLGRATVLGPYVETADGSATQWGRMILEGRSVVQWRSLYL